MRKPRCEILQLAQGPHGLRNKTRIQIKADVLWNICAVKAQKRIPKK
jgi:hypothetical protein